MPRPKPKKASRNFFARGHPLSDPARSKLIELLGYGKVDLREESVRRQMPGMKILKANPGEPLLLVRDADARASGGKTDVGKIILDIQHALGLFVHGAKHLDHIPRPADYVAAFKPIRPMTAKLFKTLAGWTEYYRDQFMLHGADIYAIENALGSLLGVSNAVLTDMEGRSSKGARKNTALREVIRWLRRIFRDKYRGPRTQHAGGKIFRSLEEEERRELAFVKTALVDARIIAKGYKGLPRLFRDPRCQPLALEQKGNIS